MKILLLNSDPFHHEVFGFLLHYFNEKGIVVDIYNKLDHEGYNNLYKLLGYKFTLVEEFKKEDYDYLILITDSNLNMVDIIPERTICINHWYKRRNYNIPNQINLAPFHSQTYKYNFTLAVHPVVKLTDKLKMYTENIIQVCIMGRSIPYEEKYLDFITNENIIFNVITKFETPLKSSKRIKLYNNISSEALFNIIANSHYILVTDIDRNHLEGYSVSASISYAFTTGCQLIIPEKMNSHLRLRSAIIYNRDRELHLEQPDFNLVYKEASEIMENRNKILDKYIRVKLIERSIHQFCILPYKSEKVPLFIKNNIMKLNPSYFYNLYTNKSLEEILVKYPILQIKYSNMGNVLGCHLKDLLMMFILYERGGIYFDLDQEPITSFEEILSDVSFASSIPLKEEDGLNLGFIACNRRSPIIQLIFDDFIQFDYNMIPILGYACLCRRAAEILRRYMNVDRLTEGIHYVKGEKILLGREVGENHATCRITFEGKVLCNSRYKDYPWDLAK